MPEDIQYKLIQDTLEEIKNDIKENKKEINELKQEMSTGRGALKAVA